MRARNRRRKEIGKTRRKFSDGNYTFLGFVKSDKELEALIEEEKRKTTRQYKFRSMGVAGGGWEVYRAAAI